MSESLFDEVGAALRRGDDVLALQLLQTLAEQGNAEAQYSLGCAYSDGRGTPQNHEKAMEWFRSAADQGYDDAQYMLGARYLYGDGVQPDDVQAYMWLALALPHDRAEEYLATAIKRMTPEQIVEAQILVRNWKPAAEMKVGDVSDSNFEAEVLKASKPVVVDFWAKWCAPCRTIMPALEEIAAALGDKIKMVKLNVDQNPDIVSKYEVVSIPTLMIFNHSELVVRRSGAAPQQDLEKWIRSGVLPTPD